MSDRIATTAAITLIGGPKDGLTETVKLWHPPGELPRHAVIYNGRKHVYQATTFTPDECGMESMRMEHVQVISVGEDLYG